MDKKVLLIADDEEMNRRIIKKFLKNSFEILEADDGKTVLELLHSRHVDALLLDIIMPEPDGLEILKYMRERQEFGDVAILVATSTKEKTERAALTLGADDVVSKPYDPLVIRKRLENILAAKEACVQQRLLETNELDSLVQIKTQELAKQSEEILNEIHNCADIIEGNKENEKLVSEFVGVIKREAEKLVTVINNWK